MESGRSGTEGHRFHSLGVCRLVQLARRLMIVHIDNRVMTTWDEDSCMPIQSLRDPRRSESAILRADTDLEANLVEMVHGTQRLGGVMAVLKRAPFVWGKRNSDASRTRIFLPPTKDVSTIDSLNCTRLKTSGFRSNVSAMRKLHKSFQNLRPTEKGQTQQKSPIWEDSRNKHPLLCK